MVAHRAGIKYYYDFFILFLVGSSATGDTTNADDFAT